MPTEQQARTSKRPTRTGRLDVAVVSGVLALCAALCAGAAWSRPSATSSVVAYSQSGHLSYTAPASATSIYGEAGVTTGQPIYTNVVEKLNITYSYEFESSSVAELTGTAQLVATIDNGQGIVRHIPLQPTTVVKGTRFAVTGSLSLADLQTAGEVFDQAAGGVATGIYVVTISPSVSMSGHLGSLDVETTFDPPATFSFTGFALAPSSPASGNTPAATGGSSGEQGQQLFSSSTQGSVIVPDGQPATLVLGLRVGDLRIAAPVVLVLSLLFGIRFGLPLLRRVTSDDERVRIAARHGSSFVETDTLPNEVRVVVIELNSFDGLTQVARQLECPILHHRDHHSDVYAVVDNGNLYRYTINPPAARPATPLAEPNGSERSSSTGLDPPKLVDLDALLR